MSARKELRVGDRVTTIGKAVGGVFTVTKVCTCTASCRIVQVKNADGDGWFLRRDLRRLRAEKTPRAKAPAGSPLGAGKCSLCKRHGQLFRYEKDQLCRECLRDTLEDAS